MWKYYFYVKFVFSVNTGVLSTKFGGICEYAKSTSHADSKSLKTSKHKKVAFWVCFDFMWIGTVVGAMWWRQRSRLAYLSTHKHAFSQLGHSLSIRWFTVTELCIPTCIFYVPARVSVCGCTVCVRRRTFALYVCAFAQTSECMYRRVPPTCLIKPICIIKRKRKKNRRRNNNVDCGAWWMPKLASTVTTTS